MKNSCNGSSKMATVKKKIADGQKKIGHKMQENLKKMNSKKK